MAYGLKYRKSFLTDTGVTRTLDIYELDFVDTFIIPEAMDAPVLSTDGSEKKEAGIFGSSMKMVFKTTTSFDADSFFSVNPRTYKAVLKEGSTTLFAGYIQGDLAKDLYTSNDADRKFELMATDALADLADIPFKSESGVFDSPESIRAFLFYALELTCVEIEKV